MRSLVIAAVLMLSCIRGDALNEGSGETIIVGGPCEGCETVFDGMPEAIGSRSRIAPEGEPGTRMRLEGTVRGASGAPEEGVIVYAYHTNAEGIYPGRTGGASHGRFRGWARTDSKGHYVFDTIRPGGYPRSGIPQHVHMHVIERGRCTYYIDDVLFTDDPRLDDGTQRNMDRGRGGSGVVTPEVQKDGSILVTRDIVLGAGIPDYQRCGPQPAGSGI